MTLAKDTLELILDQAGAAAALPSALMPLHAIKATPFTATDYRDLTEITQLLALALQTWKALKGTEASQIRAEQLIKVSQAMAHRVFHTVNMARDLNAKTLDTRTHYSVAQHSMLVSSLVPAQHQLIALLHDATEAYIGDMTRPLKSIMPGYRVVETLIWRAICDRFNLDPTLPECVVHADLVALATERRDLMPDHPGAWECLRDITPMQEYITPLSAQESGMQYFSRLMELMQSYHRRACA